MRHIVAALLAVALFAACAGAAGTPRPAAQPVQPTPKAVQPTPRAVQPTPERARIVEQGEVPAEDFASFEDLMAVADCDGLVALAQYALDSPDISAADALDIVDGIAAEERRRGC